MFTVRVLNVFLSLVMFESLSSWLCAGSDSYVCPEYTYWTSSSNGTTFHQCRRFCLKTGPERYYQSITDILQCLVLENVTHRYCSSCTCMCLMVERSHSVYIVNFVIFVVFSVTVWLGCSGRSFIGSLSSINQCWTYTELGCLWMLKSGQNSSSSAVLR